MHPWLAFREGDRYWLKNNKLYDTANNHTQKWVNIYVSMLNDWIRQLPRPKHLTQELGDIALAVRVGIQLARAV